MNNKIYGCGLCAAGAALAYQEYGTRYNVISLHNPRYNIEKVKNIGWRIDPIVASLTKYGLSKYYHGVTPVSVYLNSEYKRFLEKIKYKVGIDLDESYMDYVFVPYKKIHPKKLLAKKIDFTNLQNLYKSINYSIEQNSNVNLAMSVLGNLRYLQYSGHITKLAYIGDHVTLKCGSISYNDLLMITNQKQHVVKTNKGTLFNTYITENNNAQLFFRPYFGEIEFDIDYTASAHSILKLCMKMNSISKIREAIFNRYGYPQKYSRYNIYCQIKIDKIYILDNGKLTQNSQSKSELKRTVEEILDEINSIAMTFSPNKNIFNKENIFPGIHLSYDRNYIKNIPSKITVLDTSLASKSYHHCSIEAMCISNIMIKSKFL